MKNKMMLACAAVILLIALMAGSVSGYRFRDVKMVNETENETENDRLLRVYLTKEHLDNLENLSIQDILTMTDINQDFTPKDKDAPRWYARRTDDGATAESVKYEFDVPGYAFFNVRVTDMDIPVTNLICDDVISGVRQEIHTTDGKESFHMEGDVYVLTGGPLEVLYINPVYQTPEGEVYMTAGSGLGLSESLAYSSSISQEINENYTETAKNGAGTASNSRENISGCRLTFYPKEKAEEICLIAFNEENEKISEEKIQLDDLPESLEISKETAYLMLVEKSADSTKRTMLTKEDSFVRFYIPRDDGVFEGQDARLEWK